MTSEIAVMNQHCIALAADSAVTLIEGRKVVVRNGQRKLFDLSSGVPVGVMFYGMADLMGHPWDVLIEHIRKKGRFGSLARTRDYAAKCTAMLDGLEEFFPRDRQKDEYRRLLASVFRFLLQLAQYMQESAAQQGRSLSKTQILREAVELVWQRYQFHEDGKPRRDLPCFPQGFGATVARDHSDAIGEMISLGFSNFAPDPAVEQKLRDIAVFCVVKDLFLEDVTGLVFAGYGTSERYPSLVTYYVSAVIGGILKRSEIDVENIDSEMHSAITLFADCEATYGFLRGIELDLEIRLYGTIQSASEALVDQVLAASGLEPARRDELRRQFRAQHVPQTLNRIYSAMANYQQQAYLDPVLHVLEIATRQDMAETARDLVALNIFKKRIMARQPTVGGDIDVALISREDGFRWWKKQGGRA